MFFPGGLQAGRTVQLMRRDPARMAASALASAGRLRDRANGRTPIAVLQFDCAGRGSMVYGKQTYQRLIGPVQKAFAPDVPWVGFHTYGEIAPISGRTYFHNYSVVLLALYERDVDGDAA